MSTIFFKIYLFFHNIYKSSNRICFPIFYFTIDSSMF
nr:MAG TPA: hypothetical protein [Caudoviricetes sp.]